MPSEPGGVAPLPGALSLMYSHRRPPEPTAKSGLPTPATGASNFMETRTLDRLNDLLAVFKNKD